MVLNHADRSCLGRSWNAYKILLERDILRPLQALWFCNICSEGWDIQYILDQRVAGHLNFLDIRMLCLMCLNVPSNLVHRRNAQFNLSLDILSCFSCCTSYSLFIIIYLAQVRTQNFSLWGGGRWPCGYIEFMFDFKSCFIKIML